MLSRLSGLLAAVVLTLVACGGAVSAPPSSSPTASAARYPLTVTDDRGKALTLRGAPARIVSFAPSATEIVFALGAGDRIVATDDFSDFPPEAKALPKLGGIRTSPEKIVALAPDLILAISSGNLPAQLDSLGQPLFIFDANDIEGVYGDILLVGRLLDLEQRAREVIADMRTRID